MLRQFKSKSGAVSLLWNAAKKEKVLLAGIILSVAGAVIFGLLPPLLLEKFINQITDGQVPSWALAAGYFGLLALTGVTESLREVFLTIFGQKITHTMRTQMCEKMTRLPVSALSEMEPGTIASRFVGDVDTLENLFTSGIISMFADACTIISIFAVLLYKNTGLVILLLALIPLIWLFTRAVQKKMLAAQLENRAAAAKTGSQVPETIRCIRMIHVLQKEGFMRKKYDGCIQECYDAVEKTNLYDAFYSPVVLIINALVVALVMALSASPSPALRSFFGMSVGTAVAVISYISKVFSPIESIGMEIQTIQSAVAGVQRIDAFLNLPERWETEEEAGKAALAAATASEMCKIDKTNIDPATDAKAVTGGADVMSAAVTTGAGAATVGAVSDTATSKADETIVTSAIGAEGEPLVSKISVQNNFNYESTVLKNPSCVEFENVTFGYDKTRPVLKNKSFTVSTGEQVTFIGRTGAGKSTIFRLLLGQYRAQSGQVKIFGQAAEKLPDSCKRRLFGYVEQHFYMVPGTVLDQITLFDPAISAEQAQDAARLAGLEDTILNLEKGYDTPCTPTLFSQGQWQLLAVARAVAAHPPILLLDEITANLDAGTEKEVLSALTRASRNRTVLSISHRMFEENLGSSRVVEVE